MNPQRKKIYIILIIVCFGLSAAILAWNFFGSAPVAIPPHNATPAAIAVPGASASPSDANPIPSHAASSLSRSIGDFTNSFPAPEVFPVTNTFNTQTLDSSDFKGLMDYTPLTTTGQIGRDNPFKNY